MVSTLVQFALGVGSLSLFATTSHARTLAARDFITPTDLPGTWSAQGCYIDVGRTLTNGGYDDEIGMTAESCVAYCDAAGYRYAGTEYFHECFCGDTLTTGGVPANANDCSTPCAGNPEEACGGPNRLSLFWNGKSAPEINPGANGWNFLGCYTEATDGRILANYMDIPAGTLMTVDVCNTACRQSGYTLSGIEYGDECYCGNQFDNAGAPAIDGLAGCDMLCPGNSSEYCGGPLRLETYQFGSAIPPVNPSSASSVVSTPASTSSSSSIVSTSSSVVVPPVPTTSSTTSIPAVVSTSSSVVVPPVAASTSSTSSSSSAVVPPVAASTSSTSSSGGSAGSSSQAAPAAPTCSAVSQISLGSASTFGVLSYASITNTGPSVINGDIGTTGTSITGFPPGVYSGTKVIAGAASAALADAKAAYTQIANLAGATVLTGNLAGKVLAPGTYKFATSANLAAGGVLTLEGTGADSDRWYFQIGSTLVTGAGSEIDLTNGALACNVFWQVGSSATIGVGADFEGTILAAISVTVGTAATVHGGVFGLGASVTLQICEVDYQYCAPAASSCTVASTTSSPSTSSSVVPTTSSSSTSSSALPTSSSSSSRSSSVPSTSSSVSSTSSSSSSASSSIVPTTSSSSVVSSTSSSSSVAPAGTLGVKPVVGDYTFQGCYSEGEGVRALSGATFIDYEAMTLEECAASCSNFDYFGVEYWGECYCGDAIDPTSTLVPNQGDCNFICPGNTVEYCGAGNRIEMYKKGALPSTSGSTSAPVTTSSSVSSDLPASTSSSDVITTTSSSVVSSAPSSSTDLPSSTTSATSSAAASSTSPSSTALPTSTDASSTSSPTSSCTSGPRPSNLIPNPSFEDSTSNDWHFLDGSITTDASHSGSASAVLNGDDGDYSIVYDFVPYNSVWGQTIYLSYWAKFTGAGDNSCSFQAMTGSATLQEVDNLESFDWTEFTATYSVPDNDQSEGFAVAFMCNDLSASLYIDDVYFGPSPPVTICSGPSSSVEPSAATSSSSPSSSSAPSSSVEIPAATSSSAPSSSVEIPAASSSSSDIPAAASSSAPASSSDPQTAAPSSTSSSDPVTTSSAPSSSVDPVAAPSSTPSASDPPAATTSQPASVDPTTSSSTTSAYVAPSTTSSVYTGPPTPSIVPSALNGQCVFVGCYSEATNSRALKDDTLIDYVGMTVEKCAAYCGTKYDLFGVEYSGECYCGDSLQQGSNLRSPTVCNMLCDGNHLEYCGGGDLLNVYSCASTPSSTPVAPTTTPTTAPSIAPSTTSIPSTPSPTTTAYTGPPTPSIVQSTNGYKYSGCYTEANNGRALKEKTYVNYNTMTVEMCASICGPTYPMFGVEWSGECYCGYSLQQGSAQVADTQCNSICDGNSLEYCGGGSRLNVYTQVTGTTTITTSTTAGTPAPTSGSSSGFPNVGAYSYVSCYTEGNNLRALSAKTTAYDGMTLESCANDCSAYSYFGVEYGRECYCGNSFSAGAVPTAQSECYFPCAGNGKEICGAGLRLSVYSTSNPTPVGPVPSNPATVLGYEFYGCQTEGANSRALKSFSTAYDTMTLESCARDCQGFEYFGTEYGRECYCGNSFQPGSVPAPAASCESTDFLCAGNDLEFCGARSLLTVYKLP